MCPIQSAATIRSRTYALRTAIGVHVSFSAERAVDRVYYMRQRARTWSCKVAVNK